MVGFRASGMEKTNTHGPGMNYRLRHIQNWLELAEKAEWKVLALAKECGVSVRTLELYFCKNMGKKPKAWMTEERNRRALQKLESGSTVKETALSLHYKHPSHLTNDIKKHQYLSPGVQTFHS